MLIGHYAPALVLQRARPSVKLWQLFVATQLVDVFWGLFILTGVEHARIVPGFTQSNDLDLYDMPYTHSLVATGAWALVAFVGWKSFRKGQGSTLDALVIAVAVASHFAGDYLVHAQDLPVMAAQGPKLGLGLWRDRTAALILETALFAGAALYWWLPQRDTMGATRVGVGLLILTAVAAISFFVPTPPSPAAMALTGLLTYALCAWWAATANRATAPRP
ncbi:MAG: hypothetical protein JST54_13345 [Deltaproteobacteria bacterium]|nr:hypothetical protein [Deltaproteobacteria bacterium]